MDIHCYERNAYWFFYGGQKAVLLYTKKLSQWMSALTSSKGPLKSALRFVLQKCFLCLSFKNITLIIRPFMM